MLLHNDCIYDPILQRFGQAPAAVLSKMLLKQEMCSPWMFARRLIYKLFVGLQYHHYIIVNTYITIHFLKRLIISSLYYWVYLFYHSPNQQTSFQWRQSKQGEAYYEYSGSIRREQIMFFQFCSEYNTVHKSSIFVSHVR